MLIRTKGGHVNMRHVVRIDDDRSEVFKLYLSDGTCEFAWASWTDVERACSRVVPAGAGYMKLSWSYTHANENGGLKVERQPILAWLVPLDDGRPVPVTLEGSGDPENIEASGDVDAVTFGYAVLLPDGRVVHSRGHIENSYDDFVARVKEEMEEMTYCDDFNGAFRLCG